MAEAAGWVCSSCSSGRHFCDLIDLDMTRFCDCLTCIPPEEVPDDPYS